tara:strand:+ start:1885 stop:2538 length:654 start_codon:yes stop_codon:yes gene_type:complete
MKSIIIFGKGPSLLKCTKDIVDNYDDIAICNYPVLNDFFCNLIQNRTINYHFANCGTFDERYNDNINNLLQIQGIYNTNKTNTYSNYISNKNLFKDNLYNTIRDYFLNNFDLDPATGTMAIQYILNLNKYDKICLVGFDNFQKGSPWYYYNPDLYNPKLKYLLGNQITEKGIYNQISGHCPEKTLQYYLNIIEKNKNIQYTFITNLLLPNKNNLKVI